MFLKRFGIIGLALGLGLGVAGCTDGYGYGGAGVGYASDPYYGGGYGAYGGGYAPAGYAVETEVAPQRDDAYCVRRFRSYDRQSGTYLGNDGQRHACP